MWDALLQEQVRLKQDLGDVVSASTYDCCRVDIEMCKVELVDKVSAEQLYAKQLGPDLTHGLAG